MNNFFEKHCHYVLVGGEQHNVMLDDANNPTRMWSTIGFMLGESITVDGGRPRYKIIGQRRDHMGVNQYKLSEDT
jgi:hypothetical protein